MPSYCECGHLMKDHDDRKGCEHCVCPWWIAFDVYERDVGNR